jgi:hypothetical protein
MRIPIKGDDYFAREVNCVFQRIKDAYIDGAKLCLQTSDVPVMLGDGSVSQSSTFEIPKIVASYERVIGSLHGWVSSKISSSNTEDLHRIYFQIGRRLEKFQLHGYFGIQFHVLPYYMVDRRVIEIQKELSQIAEGAAHIYSSIANRGDSMVRQELQKIGYSELEFEELFMKLFEDQELVHGLEEKAQDLEKRFPEFEQMRIKKNQLYTELNDLSVELNQISPLPIDYNGLMQGEEGVVTYFDIETIRNQKGTISDPYINTEKVTKNLTDQVVNQLNQVAIALKEYMHT